MTQSSTNTALKLKAVQITQVVCRLLARKDLHAGMMFNRSIRISVHVLLTVCVSIVYLPVNCNLIP